MAILAYRVAQWLCWAGVGFLAVVALGAGISGGEWTLLAKMAWPLAMLVGLAGFFGRQARRRRDAPPAPPYTGAPIADPSRQAVRRLGAAAAVSGLAPAVLTPALSGASLAFFWVAGLFVAALLLLVAAVVRGTGRLQARQIEALLAGGHWVHWEYGDGEWERFTAAGWQARRQADRKLLLAFGGGTAALALVVLWAAQDWLAAAAVAAAGLAAAALVWSIGRAHARRSYSGRFREVLIGPAGAYMPGERGHPQQGRFHQWQGMGLELRETTLRESDPWVLELEISAGGHVSHTIALPVPRGREQEAAALVDRLRAEQAE